MKILRDSAVTQPALGGLLYNPPFANFLQYSVYVPKSTKVGLAVE